MNANLTVTLDKSSIELLVNEISDKISISSEKSDFIPKPAPPALLSIKDLCQFFRVSRVTIHKWMKDGRIPYRKVNRRVYFILEEVLNSINKFDFKTVASAKESILNGRGR
ncbi:MAG: helix-turn-helix domain-containing protein [Candidatus Kapabacteria bacterium]|nr:helix-turn-helix domain-containing protein [Ignavibacteriota bacterium]MCW5883395.1 helix-turn-helix domain-containing protein [Candidatus Kapabacteria bacterium]